MSSLGKNATIAGLPYLAVVLRGAGGASSSHVPK